MVEVFSRQLSTQLRKAQGVKGLSADWQSYLTRTRKELIIAESPLPLQISYPFTTKLNRNESTSIFKQNQRWRRPPGFAPASRATYGGRGQYEKLRDCAQSNIVLHSWQMLLM